MRSTIKVLKNIANNKEDKRLRSEPIEIPPENLSISRSHMPQISPDQRDNFLKSLEDEGISHQFVRIAPIHLKATQGEFNLDKVRSIIEKKPPLNPVIVSKDHFILDGHHRWLADYNIDKNEPTPMLKIDLPILDLLAQARRFRGVDFKSVTESAKYKIRNNL
jgi:hypothetical protein